MEHAFVIVGSKIVLFVEAGAYSYIKQLREVRFADCFSSCHLQGWSTIRFYVEVA